MPNRIGIKTMLRLSETEEHVQNINAPQDKRYAVTIMFNIIGKMVVMRGTPES